MPVVVGLPAPVRIAAMRPADRFGSIAHVRGPRHGRDVAQEAPSRAHGGAGDGAVPDLMCPTVGHG